MKKLFIKIFFINFKNYAIILIHKKGTVVVVAVRHLVGEHGPNRAVVDGTKSKRIFYKIGAEKKIFWDTIKLNNFLIEKIDNFWTEKKLKF